MAEQLERLFNPASVAVVGASTDPEKRGYRTIEDLDEWGYDGEVYPVNPRYEEVRGREAYPSVADVPGGVDLVFVTIPAPSVPDVIRESGAAGAAGAVVNTAGFSEVGEDGLANDLRTAAREADVRIVGPNIQGIDAVHQHLHLLGHYRTTPGRLGLLTQSGNMGVDLSVDARDYGDVGFSYNIGVGNETDIEFGEYLDFLAADDHTDGVTVYAEGMENGRSFLETAGRVSRETPIVAFKAGRTSAGKASAVSHSASLAGEIDVVDAAYRQAGVIRVDELDLVVSVAAALTQSPASDGSDVAVLTDGGGHGTVASDVLTDAGLSLPELATETRAKLSELFPISPNLGNPVDVMGQSSHIDMWAAAPEIILGDPNVDMLLITGAYGGYEEHWTGHGDAEPDEEPRAADRIVAARNETGKPVVVHSLFAELGSAAFRRLRAGGVPVCDSVADATACLDALAEYGRHCRHAGEKSDFALPTDDENRSDLVTGSNLSEHDAKRLLEEYDAPVAPSELATIPGDAVDAAAAFDGSVAMKVVSPDVLHKTEAGGVKLDVDGESAVRRAFGEIVDAAGAYDPAAAIEGVSVSPMVDDGVELIVGVVSDPEVGPVVTCGVGGVLVEAIDDAAFRALPVTDYDAREMIDEIEAQALLDGPRDRPAVDREALVSLLCRVSDLVMENPGIAELDLNPVVATEDGLSIVDAAVTLD